MAEPDLSLKERRGGQDVDSALFNFVAPLSLLAVVKSYL